MADPQKEVSIIEVICVVQELKETQQRISIQHEKLRWIVDEKAPEGQSTSVNAGLEAVSPQSEAALFLVGDQPLSKAELINGLVDLFRKRSAKIVAPTFQGQTRNPVLFHRDLFPELLKLTGDRGGKGLIETYRDRAAFVEWDDETPFLDLDVWKDYEELRKL